MNKFKIMITELENKDNKITIEYKNLLNKYEKEKNYLNNEIIIKNKNLDEIMNKNNEYLLLLNEQKLKINNLDLDFLNLSEKYNISLEKINSLILEIGFFFFF
jgi:beta-N-acetylglucosaminidase